MSTAYISTKPLTIQEVEDKTGWHLWISPEGPVFTDDESYIHTTILSDNTVQTFDRYGIQTTADEFVNVLELVSEHDDNYWEIFEGSFGKEESCDSL